MRKLLIVVLLALLAASCASSDESADPTTTTTAPGAPADLTPAVDDPALDAITVTQPEAPEGDPGIELDGTVSIDTTARRVLSEGDGTAAEEGTSVSFHFAAVNGRTGERFDGTRPGNPASITLDPAGLLPGIYRSLVDLPAGTQVLSAVSPSEAFGPQGGFAEQGVEADDTLVFVFDLLSVAVPLERAAGTPVDPPEGLPTVTLADNGAPTIELPDGDPPAELVGQVLITGDGPVVESGQKLTVHYTGITWPRGEQFDSSWDGSPASFDIGVGAVIPGWDQALVGQTVGSQVLLVIPPEQGYGTEGNADAGILGTDTLVFVVDILAAV